MNKYKTKIFKLCKYNQNTEKNTINKIENI
jgi:hypothetical protein